MLNINKTQYTLVKIPIKEIVNQEYNVELTQDQEIDNEYLTSYVNMRKYPIILFIMAKIMEMNSTEQNQIAMYLYNNI